MSRRVHIDSTNTQLCCSCLWRLSWLSVVVVWEMSLWDVHRNSIADLAHEPTQHTAESVEDVHVLRAALSGDVGSLSRWLAAGGKVSATTSDGLTPLHVAVQEGHVDAVRVLLQAGADPNEVSGQESESSRIRGSAALHHAALRWKPDSLHPLLDVLLLHNADPDLGHGETGETPALLAYHAGQLSVVAALAERGADMDAVDQVGWGILHYAAAANDVDGVRSLLRMGASPDAPTQGFPGGDTPLHVAVGRGNVEVVEVVLDEVMRAGGHQRLLEVVGAVNDDGQSVLHEAALGGRVRSAYALLRAASTLALPAITLPSFQDAMENPDDAFADAERLDGDDIESVLFALESGDSLFDSSSAPTTSHLSTVRALRDGDGNTPLHLAVREGQFEVALTLIRAGAPLDTPHSQNGYTPLHYAASKGNVAMVRLLMASGASLTVRSAIGHTPLHSAASSGDLATLSLLLDSAAGKSVLSAPDLPGFTPLHLAAMHGFPDLVEHLVAAGASLSALTERDQTPLDLATSFSHAPIVHILDAAHEQALLHSLHGPISHSSSKS